MIDKQLERELDNLALLELKEKEYCLRFRTLPEDSGEDVREKVIKALADFLDYKRETLY